MMNLVPAFHSGLLGLGSLTLVLLFLCSPEQVQKRPRESFLCVDRTSHDILLHRPLDPSYVWSHTLGL